MEHRSPIVATSILMIVAIHTNSNAQVPALIVQERCIGGSDIDDLVRMRPLDTDLIVAIGHSASANGDLTGNNGMYDAWIIRADQMFDPLISIDLGGPVDEKARDVALDDLENIIVLINSQGTEFGCSSGANIAVNKISSSGAPIDWTCQVGSLYDEGVRVLYNPVSGNSLVMGNIRSTDGFYAPYTHHGQVDIGVFEYDGDLDLVRGALIGSTGFDLAKDAVLDGNDLWIFGETNGTDGDMAGTTAFGSDDLVALKWSLDTWSLTQKYRYGGTDTEHVERVSQRPGGGFAWFGNTWSTTFFSCSNPSSNAFAMGTSANGTLDWTQCLQGSGTESISSAIYSATHGVHFVGGHSSSTDDDFIGGDPNWQAFVAAVNDGDGEVIWKYLFGGTGGDHHRDLLQLPTGNLLTLNWTSSTDGDVQSTNHGMTDAWLVEFSHTTAIADRSNELASLQVSPVPTSDLITVQLPAGTQRIELYDVHGRCVSAEVLGSNRSSHVIDLSARPAGIYTIRTSASTPNGTGRCVKL